MDATQKQRMWKVAISHFALSTCVAILLLLDFKGYFGEHAYRGDKPWSNFLENFFGFLQPQFCIPPLLIITAAAKVFPPFEWFLDHPSLGLLPILLLFVVLIPVWSLFMGWLYVKAVDWLNHFPVLGKRVF